jgi:hypothetical protein
MRLCYDWSKREVNLNENKRYHPRELMDQLSPSLGPKVSPLVHRPLWIRLDSCHHRIQSSAELWLACRLAAAHHNECVCVAPPDDGWAEETAEMEARAAERMMEAGVEGR